MLIYINIFKLIYIELKQNDSFHIFIYLYIEKKIEITHRIENSIALLKKLWSKKKLLLFLNNLTK